MEENNFNAILNRLKRATINVFKSAIMTFGPIIATIVIIIILISSFVHFITIDDGSYKKDDWSSTPYAVSQNTGNSEIDEQGNISMGFTAKELWDKMIENGSRVDEYLDGPEDLLKLMNAELITNFPDTRANPDDPIDWDTINKDINSKNTQGIIKFKRAKSDGSSSRMTFADRDTFYEWIESYNATGNQDALNKVMNHFTIEENISISNNFSPEDITTEESSAIVEATYSTATRGPGLCQSWVYWVYKNAGLPSGGYATAYEAFKANVVSTDMNNIPIGATVYGTGTNYAGHVGIYIGNGKIRDSITRNGQGYINESTIEEWLSWQTNVIDGKKGWLGWGWQSGAKNVATTSNTEDSTGDEQNVEVTQTKSYSVVVATSKEIREIVTSDDPDVSKKDETKYIMTTENINYLDLMDGYTMPFNYLWALLVTGRQKEFVLELADLVYNSEIEITIYDNWTKVTEEITNKYTKMETEKDPDTGEEIEVPHDYYRTDTTITQTNTLNTILSKANVWIANYNQSYSYEVPKQQIDGPTTLEEGKTKKTTIDKTQYNYSPATTTEKTDINSDEPNFVNIFMKQDYFRTRNNIFSAPDWLFEILEKNQDTASMVDLTKYLFYKATGTDYGVTEADSSFFDPTKFQGISTGSEGGLSLTTTMFTKDEFRQAMQAYYDKTGNQNFYNNFLSKVDELYDASIANNINPELVVITAKAEGNFSESGGQYNYWGIGVPNGANAGTGFSSLSDGIAGYANVIHSYETGNYAAMITRKYQERKAAGCDPLGYGLPGTLSGMQSLYSYLGKHVEGGSGAGGYYYMDPAVKGVTKIYKTHEEFLEKCKNSGLPEHAYGTETTVWEQGQYTAWQVEIKLQTWDAIFGEFGDRSEIAK